MMGLQGREGREEGKVGMEPERPGSSCATRAGGHAEAPVRQAERAAHAVGQHAARGAVPPPAVQGGSRSGQPPARPSQPGLNSEHADLWCPPFYPATALQCTVGEWL